MASLANKLEVYFRQRGLVDAETKAAELRDRAERRILALLNEVQ